ncbi:MAG: sulfatase-like hydrolase/transferase [Gemmatimonadetes bacterium]|jgi:hypothetical protein|nr:sulfatase-like hydrolase/transferase [Gemmatimonadota bacterium]MBT6145930.1 sulfatase-like hydrolase/transferase [Gemmatimonadota bacterium]MBT7863209.1 sulfatase-like hydrolase/transferase [Gemmatimonadota bacterium]
MTDCSKFLLISIDCWRCDAISRLNPSLLTPKFDVLTKDYALAERFFVTAPATRPSHTSLFTGLYPFEHGVFGQTYLKMFAGVSNLLQLMSENGFEVSGRSQRPEVFRFLDYESFIGPLDSEAREQTLASIEPTLRMFEDGGDARQLRFLHFWYAHGGYGLGGIDLKPTLRELIAAGREAEAVRYYHAAAVHVQEFLLVEILKRIDLSEWTVFIFGDHGEGLNSEIMSHGDMIHERVARVPLLAHIPKEGWTLPDRTLSMIDLFPTICELAGIETDYRGYGQSLLHPGEDKERWVLTELDSLFGVGFLHKGNLETEHRRVTSRLSIDGDQLPNNPDGVRQWALNNGEVLFRDDETNAQHLLRNVYTGEPLACDDAGPYREIYRQIIEGSAYGEQEEQQETAQEKQALEQRLKDLGYL